MIRPVAQTRVWCDRGRARLPRSRRGNFFGDALRRLAGAGESSGAGPVADLHRRPSGPLDLALLLLAFYRRLREKFGRLAS